MLRIALTVSTSLLVSFGVTSRVWASVYISEFVASNATGLQDETGDRPDWIELHNDGSGAVNLLGWKILDGSSAENVWVFPEYILAPDTYLVIFASGEDRRKTQPFHTDFELKRSGESLRLFTPGDSPTQRSIALEPYPEQLTGIGYGLVANEYRFLSPPSPGKPNTLEGAYIGIVSAPILSRAAGWFDNPFELSVTTSTDSADIYYTLDGSVPTPETGSLYEKALLISSTSIVRSLAYRPDYLSPEISTVTYLHAPSISAQSGPDDYPELWATDIPADYAINSNSKNLISALEALPIVSLVTDPKNLFNDEIGIYMNTEQDGSDWERPVSLEFLGQNNFQINAAIRIQGRSSRQPRTSPKHSFRILFKHPYGPTTLQQSVFDDDDDSEHNTLVLRATSNHSWTYPLAEQRERAQYLRDPWVKQTQRAMGHVVPKTKFVHLFLNRLYWGIYVITERPDDAFMAQYFGKKKSMYDVVKGGEIVAGSDRIWRRLFALSNQGLDDVNRYRAFTEIVNLGSFIDFIILNHFIGNETWDFGNWYAARHDSDGSKFRFFCWDAETSMSRIHENRVLARNTNRPTDLFQALRKNDEFKKLFARRFLLHTTSDGALTPQRNVARYKALASELDLPIVAESARWGDYRLTTHPYRTEPYEHYDRKSWLTEQSRLLTEYFPVRTEILRQQYQSIGLLEP